MTCIPTERLSVVAMANDVLFTPDEFNHIEGCRDCLEGWGDSIAESGRLLEEHDYGTVDGCAL